MLVGLLRGKIGGYFTRPAWEIEDLLTATVLGSCRYVPAEDALLPFLRRAVDASNRQLGAVLGDVVAVDIHGEESFWPRWAPDAHDTADRADSSGWTEPELVVKLQRANGTWAWVLVEAKLLSGKSSKRSDDGAVTDQLGKYWLDMRERATRAGAEPLAVVYLTTGISRPEAELAETQQELRAKGESAAPLYWLSWRTFVEVASASEQPILRDVCRLLHEEWHLAPIEPVRPWPVRREPLGHGWRFTESWRWPPSRRRTKAWAFGGAR
jgi:hypothetical protein